MNFLDFSDDFLKDAQRYCTYDENIPFQYRVIAKLLRNNHYAKTLEFMEANPEAFEDEYRYLILDFAIELCEMHEVIDENAALYRTEMSMKNEHVYQPTPEAIAFIEHLLQNGADPNLPECFNQMEHILDLEEDCSQQTGIPHDCSAIRRILDKYMSK